MYDLQKRNIDYLRISVTDRCNLRCVYCMPADGVEPIPHSEILTYEEILRTCRAASKAGIRKIKLTGGEPLVRKGVVGLVRELKEIDGIEQVTMTSNGILLGELARELAQAGLDAVNVSLDTLDAREFESITRRGGLEKVLASLTAALEAGLRVKVNCVPTKRGGIKQVVSVASLAKDRPIDVRFIELMPIGLGGMDEGVSGDEVQRMLGEQFGALTPYDGVCGNGPAHYATADGFQGRFGFISAVSDRFCAECNRIRLTATGFLKLCLHYDVGIDLKAPLRAGIAEQELTALIGNAILRKPTAHRFGSLDATNIEQHVMSQIGG